ncbi:MAG TPA: ATP-dependent RecD-like DNA helicase [Candidatus Binataceae bacterium]
MTNGGRTHEVIEGIIDQILFVNDNNGYVVARFEIEDAEHRRDSVAVVGNLDDPQVGTTMRLAGSFESHPRYGRQFRVESSEVLKPAGLTALERYLASGQIKGVGRALARRITEHFGDELFTVLDTAPHRLREVHGIGAAIVRQITVAWQDQSGLRELMVFLRGHGISAHYARRIHKLYGTRSLDVIRSDPYLLARTVHGIGFRTADAVAEQIGIPRNSIARARGAVLYLLERMAEDGHVCAPFGYLEHQFRAALDMDPDLAQQAVAELAEGKEIIIQGTGTDAVAYLRRLHQAETNVARRLHEMSQGRAMADQAIERAIAACDQTAPFPLSGEQKIALRCALKSKVAVITGGPGTGKTTLLRSMLMALDRLGIKPTLAAPTGRAARRLADATGREAKTIHRLLEYSPDTGQFIRGSMYPLRSGFVIVDEASMMDLELASSLLSALMPNCSLLLVGDRNQLPSVGPGSVLKDVIASELAPVVELTQVYRQAGQSRIVTNAHRINRGQLPEAVNAPEGDFFFIERNAPEDVLGTIKQLVSQRLIGNFGITGTGEIQVLSPMNRGPLGVHLLNRELQQLLNPQGRALAFGEREIREGDRVIQLKNNYDKQIFNGDIGRVIRVDPARAMVDVAFEDSHASYDPGDLEELALAYAISVHKSQGSQYPAVVMPMHQSHYLMLRRNLIYTAITRAERVCVLVGTRAAMAQAVRNEEERRRFSGLTERLRID